MKWNICLFLLLFPYFKKKIKLRWFHSVSSILNFKNMSISILQIPTPFHRVQDNCVSQIISSVQSPLWRSDKGSHRLELLACSTFQPDLCERYRHIYINQYYSTASSARSLASIRVACSVSRNPPKLEAFLFLFFFFYKLHTYAIFCPFYVLLHSLK